MNRWTRAYTNVATALLSTLVVFVLLNALLYGFPSLRSSTAVETPMAFFDVDTLLPAYPGWSASDLIRLHDESRVVFEYEPIVEFKIKPMSGSYVNVSDHRFRLNAQRAPWPPASDAFNVFVFGGSTTFGWLLPDSDTIVSRLQELATSGGCSKRVEVYNFGHPSYMSTQEALFFQLLVTAGTAPHLAVFVDGFNEFFFRGQMAYTNNLRQMMDRSDLPHRLGPLVDLPMYHLVRRLRAKFYVAPVLEPEVEAQLFKRVIAQWIRNKQFIETIGRQYGIETAFVWQPVPTYKYDLNNHFLYRQQPLEAGERMPYDDIGRAYTQMSAMRPAIEKQQNFLWLADIQENKRENLYVDRIHYTAEFSREIAAQILVFLKTRNLLGCAG